VPGHRVPVVRDHNSAVLVCQIEKLWIFLSTQPGGLDIEDVDGRFTSEQALDDIGVDVLIRQEADCHVRFKSICRRAASRRANNSGVCWLSGGMDISISRSPTAIYSSIVFRSQGSRQSHRKDARASASETIGRFFPESRLPGNEPRLNRAIRKSLRYRGRRSAVQCSWKPNTPQQIPNSSLTIHRPNATGCHELAEPYFCSLRIAWNMASSMSTSTLQPAGSMKGFRPLF
jgi:hypothetical protein